MDPRSSSKKKTSLTIQSRRTVETVGIPASWQPEKQKVSELHSQMMKLKVENEKIVLLQTSLQNKVDQFKQQLREMDDKIQRLTQLNEDLTHRLSETTQEQDKCKGDLSEREGIWNAEKKLEEKKDGLYRTISKLTKRLEASIDKLLENNNTLQGKNAALQEELVLKEKSWEKSISQLVEEVTQLKEEVKKIEEFLKKPKEQEELKPKD